MDNCDKYVEMISCLVDSELSDEQLPELNAHMESCESCRRVYEAFKGISDTISDDLVEPPEKLAQGIMYKVHMADNGGTSRRFAFGQFTALAACLALIMFAGVHFNLFGLGGSTKSETLVTEISDEATAELPDSELSAIVDSGSLQTPANKTDDSSTLTENTSDTEVNEKDHTETKNNSDTEISDENCGLMSIDKMFSGDDKMCVLTEAPSLMIYEGKHFTPDTDDTEKAIAFNHVEPILTSEKAVEIAEFAELLMVDESLELDIPDVEPLYTIWIEDPKTSTATDLSQSYRVVYIWETDDGLVISFECLDNAFRLTATADELDAFIHPAPSPSETAAESIAPVERATPPTLNSAVEKSSQALVSTKP